MKKRYQIGIDTRFKSGKSALHILPFSCTHILFGRVDAPSGNERTFFKLEPNGFGDAVSALHHGLNYFAPVESTEKMRREKDIPAEIIDDFENRFNQLIGWDIRTQKTSFKLTKSDGGKPSNSSDISICQMVRVIDAFSGEEGKKKDITTAFRESLKARYNSSKEDLYDRTGNEMMLTLEDILSAELNSGQERKK